MGSLGKETLDALTGTPRQPQRVLLPGMGVIEPEVIPPQKAPNGQPLVIGSQFTDGSKIVRFGLICGLVYSLYKGKNYAQNRQTLRTDLRQDIQSLKEMMATQNGANMVVASISALLPYVICIMLTSSVWYIFWIRSKSTNRPKFKSEKGERN